MTTSSLIIRPPHTPDELMDHARGYVEVAQSFSPDPLPEDMASRLVQRLTTMPGYRQEQVRTAYGGGVQVGGYRMYERLLRVGEARILTGCIGGVYTRAEARNQGVARAMMEDAIAYAEAHRYGLLLLDGIPKFYHRFGFCDVYDMTAQELDVGAILELAESSYTVRPATIDDAENILRLYERQFGTYTGCFARTIEQQIHWIEHLEPGRLLVASHTAGRVNGYLFLAATQARGQFFLAGTQLWELVADDRDAAVALLHYHTRQRKRDNERGVTGGVLYSVPPTSPVAQWLAEQLEVTDISNWDAPVFGWTVREQTFRHRNAAWMARLVNLPVLTRGMLPEWQRRWEVALAHWTGDVTLVVGNKAFTLCIAGTKLDLLDTADGNEKDFVLTPQAFVQVVFGYCPIVRALQKQGYALSGEMESVLSILFPTGKTWIPASDWF